MDVVSPLVIDVVRTASRQLVRELGFMGGPFAGTDLSPSAVHALIEIEAHDGITANDLARTLHLEKSSVSRLLQKLVVSGDVVETPAPADARRKHLSLGTAGRRRVAAIHDFARAQVSQAFSRLRPGEDQIVLDGLRLYAAALRHDGNCLSLPEIRIERGYQAGLIARVTEMHARYYVRTGFGQRFESVVASGLAAFCDRLDNSPKSCIWTAVQHGEVVGSIAIDGEDLGTDIAHLRWFIVDDGARGGGIGKRLLGAAIAFVDEKGFSETQLWTFAGLDAARRLYEATGFTCVEQRPGTQWGREMLEQRYSRRLPSQSPACSQS